MPSLDAKLAGFLERNEAYDALSFGGIDLLLTMGSEAGASFAPELFLDLALPYRSDRPSEFDTFVADVIDGVSTDLSLLEVAGRLWRFPLRTEAPARRVFKRLLAVFEDRAGSRSVRVSALRGACLSAAGRERLLTSLSAAIAEIDDPSELPIVPYAARVAGLILADREDKGLLEFLTVFEDNPESADQIKVELGLICLRRAFTAASAEETLAALGQAKSYFAGAAKARASRHEAKSFELAIELLMGFIENRDSATRDGLLNELKVCAFAYDAYVAGTDADPMLGELAGLATAFTTLAIRLSNLTASLSKSSWLHATAVIEEQLLVAYYANSQLFGMEDGVGVDLLVRPRIERSVLGNHVFTTALQQWIEDCGNAVDEALVRDVRAFVQGATSDPTDADAANPSASALLERVQGNAQYTELQDILLFRMHRLAERTTPYVLAAMSEIDVAFSPLPDYSIPSHRAAFRDLAFGLLTFTEDRLNSSYEQNRQAGYLFRHINANPVERDLQQDFHSWSRARGMNIDDEVRGKGGGRADLRYQYGSCEIVVEVKQEKDDASFESLLASYGSQASQYQVTNARLVVILVMDKTRPGLEPEHLQQTYKPLILTRELANYGILIVKIVALRPRPSEASK